jgi:hypothetical protein
MQRRSQMSRPRRNRRSNMKIIAGGIVLGVSAAAIGISVASHGSGTVAAQSASYSSRSHTKGMSEWSLLNSAMDGWGSSMRSSLSQLASVNQQTFSQTTQHDKTLDVQRGIVVFASQHFLILQSKNGDLHLWALSGHTQFQNEANSTNGSTALSTNSSVSRQAVQGGLMTPEVNMMIGDATTAEAMLTPTSQPQTTTIQVAGTDLTVTVTITRNTATMTQTATVPSSGLPVSDPTTMTTSAWSTAGNTTNLARGDLILAVGTRSHGLLHASLILYTPLSVGDLGGYLGTGNPAASATQAGTHW